MAQALQPRPAPVRCRARALAVLALLAAACLFIQSPVNASASQAESAPRLRSKSTIAFSNARNGIRRTTGKVWVPRGGQLGVYGQNTNRWGYAYLEFVVISSGRGEITGQFWKVWGPTNEYFLKNGEIVNKRVVNSGQGNYYYIIAECDIRTNGDCDGSFTVSSWY